MARFNYTEFKNSYVQPTFAEFLKDKFFGIPTIASVRGSFYHWEGQEPMTEEEYNGYLHMLEHTDEEQARWCRKNADKINRLRSRTFIGHYLAHWGYFFHRMFTVSYKAYCADCLDIAIEDSIYSHEIEDEIELKYGDFTSFDSDYLHEHEDR